MGEGEATKQAVGGATPGRWAGFRRVFGAQESGLLLVIVLMMAGLTLFSPTIEQRLTYNVPTDASIERSPDDAVRVVLPSGRARVFEPEVRPRVIESRTTGVRTVVTTTPVNRFLNLTNLTQVATQASFIAIMAVGMTAIIVLAGIDLSIGSIYGLAAFVGAMAMSALDASVGWWISVPVGVGVCCLVGAACGLANGLMIVGFRVHPFVITLGMMAALRGLIFVLSQGQSIGGFPPSYTSGFFRLEFLGVYPVPIAFMVVVALIGMFVLSRTVLGRRVFATGGNETAARYAGIPVGRVKIIVYTLAGLLAGLSGAIYCGYFGAAEPGAGTAYELQVIAATVIGGASLMGGRGTAAGAVLGAIIIQLINNGMLILEIDQQYNQIVMGVAIILAVVIDQAKQRLGARGR
ncbi:MAG: ABC transporter permease [Phycisphaerales bacterium]|nr:MAG: ABC transporter permease [Phycisphaerales bacterium]